MSVPDKVLMRKIKKREKNKLKVLKDRVAQKQNGMLLLTNSFIG